jgi:Cu-Zn family superoxide dismutase
MKKIGLLAIAMALFVAIGCKNDKKASDVVEDAVDEISNTAESLTNAMTDDKKTIRVDMEPKSGSQVEGQVTFTETNGVVTMQARFGNMNPGTHAIHLHEKADCSSEDGTSTGGHWNPTHERHGKWGDAEGYHKGDIGNFEVGEDGTGEIIFETDEWCIGCDDDTKNIIGKSVIVHESPDDFVSQPTGNAGGRISCGGIIK